MSQDELNRFTEYYIEKNPDLKDKSVQEIYAIHGQDWNDSNWVDINGTYYELSTYNPKSKWDWYQIGDRLFATDVMSVMNQKLYAEIKPNFIETAQGGTPMIQTGNAMVKMRPDMIL